MDKQPGPTVLVLLEPAQCYWQPGWEGSLQRMDTCYVSMAEFLCCSPETITTLLISYPPIKVYKKGKW